jgi:hypothetical protein
MQEISENQLLVKVQFKNFEPGEFTDRQNRTYEETIRLIEDFPWEEQRDHLQVSLTNPSVTVEGEHHHFIKLALYYHDNFILYYLDDSGHLYTKSFSQLRLAYPYLHSFFADSFVDTSELELQHLWLGGKSIHFLDKDFRYSINRSKMIFLISLMGIYGLVVLITAIGAFANLQANNNAVIAVFAFLALIIVLGSLIMTQLINHLRAVKGKELILSKGSEIFYYGKAGQPRQWDKRRIIAITDFSPSKNNSTYGRTYGKVVRIDIRETDAPTDRICSIYIPSILIADYELLAKFPGIIPKYESKAFPFIPSSSTPS